MTEDTFEVDADKETTEWAEEAANIDPEVSLEIVREHFND